MPTEKNGEPVPDLADMFERGAVFADRWPTAVRVQLDVPNPLSDAVREALSARRHVFVAGAAGDGKSHLAMTVLDDWAPSACHEIVSGAALPEGLAPGTVVFLRDVSALTDDDVIGAVRDAQARGLTLFITINEGPLDSLAPKDGTGLLAAVREVIHRRSRGFDVPDPADATVINLNGRQLTRGDFVAGALAKILPVVRPCRTCGKLKTCPRVVGARELKRSREAQARIAKLLQMLTDRGRHLTAREIWTFLIDLFFAWTCGDVGDEVARQHGYFWTRVFEADNAISEAIRRDFDPLQVARASDDAHVWMGDGDVTFPDAPPYIVARRDAEEGLEMFASAKRHLFFFNKEWDVDATLAAFVPASRFGRLLERATDGDQIAPEIVGDINAFRLGAKTQADLWISRHHAFASHRRPDVLAASGKVPSSFLTVRVPYIADREAYPKSDFFPDHLLLCWNDKDQEFVLDFPTWKELQNDRNLISDRNQETLDFALDIFLSQGDPPDARDPEVLVFDHRRQRETQLRLSAADRRIEVL
ncbi:hypothetical protein ACI79C_13180 [Geodermatophilus sp. SYSU D00697]